MKKKCLIILPVLLLFLPAFISQRSVEGNVGYVGVEACKGCHEEHYNAYSKRAHGKKAVAGSPANKNGCESCHGPGAAHVEKVSGKGVGGIRSFSKAENPADKTAVCLSCHEEQKAQAFWNMSKHKSAGVSCDNCHSFHAGNEYFVKQGEPYICFECHRDIKAQANRQSHHPIKEGKVKCSDCHDPHGEFGQNMIKADAVNELCYKCHADKRGPYMWEHPPVEENCLNCHTPHGSNHNKLMAKKLPELCQQCHVVGQHPRTPYGSQNTLDAPVPGTSTTTTYSNLNRVVGRSCLACHSNIHGSSGPHVGSRGPVFTR